jgi:hypothetical protein
MLRRLCLLLKDSFGLADDVPRKSCRSWRGCEMILPRCPSLHADRQRIVYSQG